MFLPTSLSAQIYSQNIVGYFNLVLQAGDNLIANQFDNGRSNTLNSLFAQGTPEGATFTEWDSSGLTYMPLSTYSADSGWSINYTLGYGQGGLLNTPTNFTNTFAGSVWPGFNFSLSLPNFGQPAITDAGEFLLSCLIPINANFFEVVGRDPQEGESVSLLDASSQNYWTTTFENGSWSNGDPMLDGGKSAMFTLEATPEPNGLCLLSCGVFLLSALRKITK